MDNLKNVWDIAVLVFTIPTCEKTFSIMNLNKNKQQPSLTHDRFEDILEVIDYKYG
jgi:hypothetical protein